ncbi:MAG: radical SAM family heme chaperone HemW [Rickettsiales bacterium]|jgi:putative oxygen-independent coproporphyrinogen III oxidase|nr:radical SAM family heme chaperone HemW [Rickettsiales bacterium]
MDKQLSLYIHYPYCLSKCPYCDFNSHVATAIDYKDMLGAYISELEYYSRFVEKDFTISTIFFGGGTPSLMDKKLLAELLEHIRVNYKLADDIEITLEANPSTIENEKIKFFKDNGINRLSLGVQSFDEGVLKFLGRKHDVNTAISALENIQKHFSNYSLDLIYGIAGQDLKAWERNLNRALEFNSNHISLYQLTIEKGTEFYRQFKKDNLAIMDDDSQADLYDFTYSKTKKHGFERYEVSNFAKAGYESQHNLNYWRSGDYVGIGAGAHSRITKDNIKYAFVNYHMPKKWCQENLANGNAIQSKESLDQNTQIEEYIMMGLRLKEGINLQDFSKKFGISFADVIEQGKIDKLISEDLIQINANILHISPNRTGITNYITGQILV